MHSTSEMNAVRLESTSRLVASAAAARSTATDRSTLPCSGPAAGAGCLSGASPACMLLSASPTSSSMLRLLRCGQDLLLGSAAGCDLHANSPLSFHTRRSVVVGTAEVPGKPGGRTSAYCMRPANACTSFSHCVHRDRFVRGSAVRQPCMLRLGAMPSGTARLRCQADVPCTLFLSPPLTRRQARNAAISQDVTPVSVGAVSGHRFICVSLSGSRPRAAHTVSCLKWSSASCG